MQKRGMRQGNEREWKQNTDGDEKVRKNEKKKSQRGLVHTSKVSLLSECIFSIILNVLLVILYVSTSNIICIRHQNSLESSKVS